MPERKAKQGEAWTVAAEPAGTAREAERAAERARRLVAGWLLTGIVGPEEERQPC